MTGTFPKSLVKKDTDKNGQSQPLKVNIMLKHLNKFML